MKTIVLASVLAVAAAAPALARPNAIHHPRPIHHAMHAAPALVTPDPFGVYVDGHEIGRDPDANIRSFLYQDYYNRQAE